MLEICLYFPGDEKRRRKSRESKLRCNHPQLEKHGRTRRSERWGFWGRGFGGASEREVLMVFPIYWAHIFHHDSWGCWSEVAEGFISICLPHSEGELSAGLRYNVEVWRTNLEKKRRERSEDGWRRLLRLFVNKIKWSRSRAIREGRAGWWLAPDKWWDVPAEVVGDFPPLEHFKTGETKKNLFSRRIATTE